MQSIITRYTGPTNTRGSRIIARSTGGIRRTYPIRNDLTNDANHKGAAHSLAMELAWSGEWVGGAYNDKGDQIWVRWWEDKRDNFSVPDASIEAVHTLSHAALLAAAREGIALGEDDGE